MQCQAAARARRALRIAPREEGFETTDKRRTDTIRTNKRYQHTPEAANPAAILLTYCSGSGSGGGPPEKTDHGSSTSGTLSLTQAGTGLPACFSTVGKTKFGSR